MLALQCNEEYKQLTGQLAIETPEQSFWSTVTAGFMALNGWMMAVICNRSIRDDAVFIYVVCIILWIHELCLVI